MERFNNSRKGEAEVVELWIVSGDSYVCINSAGIPDFATAQAARERQHTAFHHTLYQAAQLVLLRRQPWWEWMYTAGNDDNRYIKHGTILYEAAKWNAEL